MSKGLLDSIKLETERLYIKLLSLSQLKLWTNDISMLEKELDCIYDAEPIEGIFLEIIEKQISVIERDPENYMYHSFWFIIRKTDKRVVGSMDFKNIPNEFNEVEIGYGLGQKYEHKGYMTEAINEFCKMAFMNEKIETIIADTEKGNIASEKVLERCGFKKYKEEETQWWKLEGMRKDFFVVDLEFTQYTKPTGKPRAFFPEIIEIGAIKIDCDTNVVIGHVENFVKPRFFPKQAAESMEFCMITEEDMKTAIDFSDMLKSIESLYVPGKTYFVSWGDDDYSILAQGCERHSLPNPVLQEDCLDLAAAYKLMKGDRNTTGLIKAAEEQGISTDGYWHTAYDDAVNTSKILLKLIDDGWKPEHFFASR